ncbi:DoxX family protein [Wenyingzhuangia sp. 1_MG-2023]|nr:DoxX family protein [Wenyingzhuangia sp. 1_MG-2023]
MKTIKIFYWLTTGLLSALFLFSAGMYFLNYEHVSSEFVKLGYPVYIVYPLAVLKVIAVIVLITQKQSSIKDWVYSALFFDALLAFSAHMVVKDGEQGAAMIAMILILSSFFLGKKLFKK